MRNLAYYRAADPYRAGWAETPGGDEREFWVTTNGNNFDVCVLEWCKLFADPKDKHHWRNTVSDAGQFGVGLLQHLQCSEAEFDTYIVSMRRYRDKFLAHLDSDEVMDLPQLDRAKAAVEFYHGQLVVDDGGSGDLAGYYNAHAHTAEAILRRSNGS